jgi:hypothetical protein
MAQESLVKELEAVRNKILLEKEEYWRQRSRAIWLQSGDNNTKNFHNFAKYRRISKHSWDILDEFGDVVSGQENIKKEAIKYFKEMYKEQAPPSSKEQVRVAALFKKMVTEDEAHSLNELIKLEEIEHILKKFKSDKILRPDGWSVELFSHFFETVGGDLLEMAEEARTRGRIVGGLNTTFIALTPKVNKPQCFGDFRPISLCNLCYKIISKVIANCIKPLLSRSISEEQLGFLQGRRIQDAIGTVHECLHSIKKKKTKALVLKIDLKKSYDCISWDFLRIILIQIGMGLELTEWIMSCVMSTSYSVLINGEPTTFLKVGGGSDRDVPFPRYCSSLSWRV